jgi:hypothetical protein
MIAYRDGKQIMLCDGCYEQFDEKDTRPSQATPENLVAIIKPVIDDPRRGITHRHVRCSSRTDRNLPFRCPDCVTTGEPVCTHESRP